jgi:Cys-tRNA(Pro)/Cys-tRNA(Cys) deacylase
LNQSYDKVFKTIVVHGNSKNYYVFCLAVDKELDLKQCAKLAQEKSAQMVYKLDLEKITGYIAGGCSPIGMKKTFKTWIDESCQIHESICFSGGKRGCQIEMRTQDFLSYTHAMIATFSK